VALSRQWETDEAAGARCAQSTHFANGGDGALELADAVKEACKDKNDFKFLYPNEMKLRQRVEKIAKVVYGADGVNWSPEATEKAKDLVKMAVAKASLLSSAEEVEVPITRKALVIGGGVAGIQTALDLADTGYKVYLVEKEPSIGGRMAQLDKTFPTMDCSICILAPKMMECFRHPNIKLLTYSELREVKGSVGNFRVKIHQKARYVDETKCTGCGVCAVPCPSSAVSW
jgi:heterodisulfide reductase subunit A-like polyferredoxin